MICPGCNREVIEGKSTCPFCSLIFAKWKGPLVRVTPEPDLPIPLPEPQPEAVTERIKVPTYLIGIVAALMAVLIVALGVRFFMKGIGTAVKQHGLARPNPGSASASSVRGGTMDPRSDFDLMIDSGGDPLGLAWGNGEFIIGNRASPWGFLRLKPISGPEFNAAESVPVIESTYNQQVSFRTVAWNGNQYAAYTDGSWFDKSHKNVFTLHDPGTLAVTGYFPAPELIGGLVWDGSGYWAATRRNTEDSREPAFLYHFDKRFNLLGKYDAPAVGCQGLAWDGTHLWWVDVFTDKIYLLKADGAKPQVVHTYQTQFSYLSGVAFDGSHIWISEYGEKRLRRLNPKLSALWGQGEYRIGSYEQARPLLDASSREGPGAEPPDLEALLKQLRENPEESQKLIEQLDKIGARDQAVRVLQKTLRSPDSRLHTRAKEALLQIGVLPEYDRYVNSYTRTSDEADVIESSAEVFEDRLYVSWRIYYGSQIFAGSSSAVVARYKVTVKGNNLVTPVVKEYEAQPGDNVRSEEMVTRLAPGRYTIEVAITAQFVDSTGANKVINRTAPSLEVGR
jgi:hypothetical protein